MPLERDSKHSKAFKQLQLLRLQITQLLGGLVSPHWGGGEKNRTWGRKKNKFNKIRHEMDEETYYDQTRLLKKE